MDDSQKADLIFEPTLQDFLQSRRNKLLTVLSGGNNSGKSLTLKWLKVTIGIEAYMVGVNRFYHVYHLGSSLREQNEVQNYENSFRSGYQQEQFNYEQNVMGLEQIIRGLNNSKREILLNLCGDLLGTTFSLRRVEEDNDLSVSYVDMGGQNLSVGSTGTRLLMTILGICMDDRFECLLIDEPELGLSPNIQQVLVNVLEDPESRQRYFPHLRSVFIATHSHLFLSRIDIQDNYVVSKAGQHIRLKQVETINDFHKLQFNLLGNNLETMFFPSAIVVVEGPTDYEYLTRVIQLRFPSRKITVISSGGDVKKKVAGLRETFGDLNKTPYRSRLFVVLDSVHQLNLSAELQSMGVEAANIITWDRNGIEYIYPNALLADVYACAPERVREMAIQDDRILLNGVTKTKVELSKELVRRLDSATKLPNELEEKFLRKISTAID
jgi:predicted ATP-dependent endonuclease of OLD family